MKIDYEFNNETVEIEVEEKWGNIILNLNRQEYNSNRRETRRHCSLELCNPDDCEIPSDSNVSDEVLLSEDLKLLRKVLPELEPRQKRLIKAFFFDGVSQTELAVIEGVSPQAIHQTIERGLKKLKKFFI